jgi:hypothetical protein
MHAERDAAVRTSLTLKLDVLAKMHASFSESVLQYCPQQPCMPDMINSVHTCINNVFDKLIYEAPCAEKGCHIILIWILICFGGNLLWQQMPTNPTKGILGCGNKCQKSSSGIWAHHNIHTVIVICCSAIYWVVVICIGTRQIDYSMADTPRKK